MDKEVKTLHACDEQPGAEQEMGEVRSDEDQHREDEIGHPHGLQMALLTVSLMFAVFIMALDTTILCMFTRFKIS